jgi:hypothetical protein
MVESGFRKAISEIAKLAGMSDIPINVVAMTTFHESIINKDLVISFLLREKILIFMTFRTISHSITQY